MPTPLTNKIVINGKKKGMGYLKSFTSHKDFSAENPEIQKILNKVNLGDVQQETRMMMARSPKPNSSPQNLPPAVDFRKSMTPVRDQGELGSCTAFAASGIVEYFEQKANKKFTPLSTMFTYKTTRNLMKVTGDTGAFLRTVMGSIALFGSPPEEYWEYNGNGEGNNNRFDQEPPPFCYAFASNFQSTRYLRIDQPNFVGQYTLNLLKKFLQKQIPIMFGFTCFESLYQSNDNGGKIPYPSSNEHMIGGHAITMCGYDDKLEITNTVDGSKTVGAIIIKNSWSEQWGDKGYGYIPYRYIVDKIADDCWTLVSQEWVDHLPFQE